MSGDMITADDPDADLCTVNGLAHDWRPHVWRAYPYAAMRTSWRCVWCHVVACGNYTEPDPCMKPYHHATAHVTRSGIVEPMGTDPLGRQP